MKPRTHKWLLPLLAVVLNFGGGPMAWAQLVPQEAAAPAQLVAVMGDEVAAAGHCGGSQGSTQAPDESGTSPSGDRSGCCAAGFCHCGCPVSLSMDFAAFRGAHERPAAPPDAAVTRQVESRFTRLLRPPIS